MNRCYVYAQGVCFGHQAVILGIDLSIKLKAIQLQRELTLRLKQTGKFHGVNVVIEQDDEVIDDCHWRVWVPFHLTDEKRQQVIDVIAEIEKDVIEARRQEHLLSMIDDGVADNAEKELPF